MTRKGGIAIALSLAFTVPCPLEAQDEPSTDLLVEVAGLEHLAATETLDSLAIDTVSSAYHDNPEARYVGVALHRLIARFGGQAEGLRGGSLAGYVVLEARDGYRIVLGLGQVDPTITGQTTLLAREVDGARLEPLEGPWRLIVPGDKRGTRWIRQVTAIRVVMIDDE
jgi:hypothetical protein